MGVCCLIVRVGRQIGSVRRRSSTRLAGRPHDDPPGPLARQEAVLVAQHPGVLLAPRPRVVPRAADQAVAARLEVGGVFVFIGFTPNTNIIADHFKHDAQGYAVTDDRMMTSVPGLFAAGDLRVQLTRQVTTAVGDATTAAIAVEKYLAERKEKEAPREAAVGR